MRRPVSAPIAVFAYDRPDMVEATLAALARCSGFSGGRVHVFCDASGRPEREAGVAATRRIAGAWCAAHGARLILREANLGFRSITEGVSELCAVAGSVISLEDDHLPEPGLLAFLDQGLAAYRHDERVFQIAGYRLGSGSAVLPETFFLPMPMPIGWATWERAWNHFRWDIGDQATLLDDPTRCLAFDLDGSYPASVLLRRALAGTFDSYFIRWYLAMFAADGLALCARDSLVLNQGLASGVHGRAKVSEARERFFNSGWSSSVKYGPWELPTHVAVDQTLYQRLCGELRERTQAASGG